MVSSVGEGQGEGDLETKGRNALPAPFSQRKGTRSETNAVDARRNSSSIRSGLGEDTTRTVPNAQRKETRALSAPPFRGRFREGSQGGVPRADRRQEYLDL